MCLQFQMPFHERKSQSKANYKRNLAQRDEPLKTERSGLKLSQRSRRCKREKKLFQKCQQTFAAKGNFPENLPSPTIDGTLTLTPKKSGLC